MRRWFRITRKSPPRLRDFLAQLPRSWRHEPQPQLDPRASWRASFGAASRSYDAAAWLQGAVRDELLSRLALLRAPPGAVLDLGAGTGLGSA